MNKCLLFAFILLVTTPASWADTIIAENEEDPEVLFMGSGKGTTCETGLVDCFLFNSVTRTNTGTLDQVIGIGDGKHISIFMNGEHPTLINPLLLIIGVPNDSSGTAAAPLNTAGGVGSVTSYNPNSSGSPVAGSGQLGGTNAYSGTWNTATGYVGNFPTASIDKAYKFVGLIKPGSASQNFVNWHDADLAINGIDASSFGIYVYTLTTVISGHGLVDITLGSNLPVGTFAFAYGCSQVDGNNNCTPVGNVYATPFTHVGLVTSECIDCDTNQIPEPTSLLLLGTGLLGLAKFCRKRKA